MMFASCAALMPRTRNVNAFVQQPVNETNVLATQSAELYTTSNCEGNTTAFESGGNAFLTQFGPYERNLHSVKLCGKGTFFYYATPDMDVLSVLGHVSRCGKDVTASMEECVCENVQPLVAK